MFSRGPSSFKSGLVAALLHPERAAAKPLSELEALTALAGDDHVECSSVAAAESACAISEPPAAAEPLLAGDDGMDVKTVQELPSIPSTLPAAVPRKRIPFVAKRMGALTVMAPANPQPVSAKPAPPPATKTMLMATETKSAELGSCTLGEAAPPKKRFAAPRAPGASSVANQMRVMEAARSIKKPRVKEEEAEDGTEDKEEERRQKGQEGDETTTASPPPKRYAVSSTYRPPTNGPHNGTRFLCAFKQGSNSAEQFGTIQFTAKPTASSLTRRAWRNDPDAPGAIVLYRPPEPSDDATSVSEGGKSRGGDGDVGADDKGGGGGEGGVSTSAPPMPSSQPPGAFTVVMDPFLAAKLRPHQVEGVRFIYSALLGKEVDPHSLGRGCILADDMGLGKTLQTIAVIYTMLTQGPRSNKSGEAHNAVVICPTTLCLNWKGALRIVQTDY